MAIRFLVFPKTTPRYEIFKRKNPADLDPQTASDCLGLTKLPQIASDCHGLPKTASDCLRLPRIASDYLGLPLTSAKCLRLPWIVSDCHGLL